MNFEILTGDNRDTLKTLEDNSIDAIVTDPPYGIDFLGKSWDANTGAVETYQECLRVLKPGGHILAFSAARTYHHLAVTLEQAGFEIRDQIMWIYSSGFPKAQDVGKQIQKKLGVKQTEKLQSNGPANGLARMTFNQSDPDKFAETKFKETVVCTDEIAQQWSGWKTSLKPAHEPICMARKPFTGSTRDNVLKWGVGALNIDASRIPYADQKDIDTYLNNKAGPAERSNANHGEKIGMFEGSVGFKNIKKTITPEEDLPDGGRFPSNVIGEISDEYQKYFYCPKVSRKERHIGFEDPGAQTRRARDKDGNVLNYAEKKQGASANVLVEQFQLCDKGNNHPTVKPVELMKYLIRLVTPPNSIVLDPFCGSGSTGMAATELGHSFIGCEMNPEYVEIAQKRIQAWNTPKPTGTTFESLFE
jgi:site-specific DNA-methyltransferase (adenine-specific)